jgi:Kef-type K+ transport system membrane component KefB
MSKVQAYMLLTICCGAFLMPFICRRLSLPSSVGELFFGLFAGLFFRDVFKSAGDGVDIIKFLGELGFILLMYLAGLEINFEKIKATPRKELALYMAMVFLLVIFSFGVSTLLGQKPIYSLIYLTTAVGLLFPVLKETGILESDTGQRLLIIGSIGEVVSLVALTLFILYSSYGISKESLIHLGQMAAFVLGAFIIYKFFRLLVWWYPALARPFLATGDPSESGIRANFVNMFVFVALAALLDMELIVGAFLGGMAFALIFKKREEIQKSIGGFAYGFLIPVFFIEVGLRFKINDFVKLEVVGLALAISITIFLVRLLASSVLFFTNLSLMEILLVPVSTSFALTLLAAIATFGLEHKIIDETQGASILLAAILTAFIYPGVMKKIILYIARKKQSNTVPGPA